ncbi:hypothetical protein JHK87_053659 [Glycine soja]|nr:hypothetical protein JHK87_053659 [Glycine soja]
MVLKTHLVKGRISDLYYSCPFFPHSLPLLVFSYSITEWYSLRLPSCYVTANWLGDHRVMYNS